MKPVTPSQPIILSKLQKPSAKIFTINVFAALVTIVIANAMGWVDTGEIIEDIRRFWV